MIFVELGWDMYSKQLKGYEFMFAFMPYMHTENLRYQKKGFELFHKHKKLYTTNGPRFIYNENNSSGYKNHFASKCFITAPIKGDTELRSNVYMCDLGFMFPDIASQEPIIEGDNRDTNYWNAGNSFEICCAGKVDGYVDTDIVKCK